MKFEYVLLARPQQSFRSQRPRHSRRPGRPRRTFPTPARGARSEQSSAEAPAPPVTGGIVITGRRLDVARDAITPSLGASQYTFDREALEKQPGGTNLTLNKSLLQAPGVVAGQLRRDPRPQRARQPSVPARTASSCPRASAALARPSTRRSQARSSSSPAPCRRNMATAPPA